MLYDPNGDDELPEDIAKHLNQASGNQNFVALDARDGPSLNKFDLEMHVFRNSGDAGFNVLKNLFSGSIAMVQAGIVQEAKRFAVEAVNGKMVETGVAVRMSIATNVTDLNAKLSTENLAAASQLGMAETKIKISVEGFVGNIENLPSMKTLDVSNYAEYLSAFKRIQDDVFGAEGRKDWAPAILGWKEPANPNSNDC